MRRLRSPEWLAWERRRNSLRRTIRRVQAPNCPHGPKWVESMTAHYKGLLDDHVAAEPPKYLE